MHEKMKLNYDIGNSRQVFQRKLRELKAITLLLMGIDWMDIFAPICI